MEQSDVVALLDELAELHHVLLDSQLPEEADLVHRVGMHLIGLSAFYFREIHKTDNPLDSNNIIH